MRWMLVSTALLLGLSTAMTAPAAERHPRLGGVHAELACADCHGADVAKTPRPASATSQASGCTGCHAGYARIFEQAMTTRSAEKHFAKTAFGQLDPNFFANNCSSCHVTDCLDCHGGDGHNITAATQQACLACHKGYFVGREYLGMAPREDHPRYQRGAEFLGETSLKMRPDLHAEIGLQCMDCHSMQSLLAGQKTAKTCVDCHRAGPQVIEHAIPAHLEKMECYACHAAWAPQDYGTFYLRVAGDQETAKRFKAEATEPVGDYLVRTYLRQQTMPPLGLNERGLVSPIRPQFIAYYSDLRHDGKQDNENLLRAARWKAFFPHTIRSGTVMCDSCHDNRRRYLLEKEEERQYRIDLDGLGLSSFWSQGGQQIDNGAFISPQRYAALAEKTAAYTKAYVKKWKNLVERVEESSKE